MIIFRDLTRLKAHLDQLRTEGKSLGFFPTMGALHEGHLALLRAAQSDADISVCSIFVNPTQFNNPADLEKYPRTLSDDLLMLEDAGCDLVIIPESDELYAEEKVKSFELDGIDVLLEGASRPGHFQGVARVVNIFFDLIQPDFAYFGLKDFQQCMVIDKVVDAYHPKLNVKFIETQRASSGLAMSSRNKRLNAEETDRAKVIYEALNFARTNLKNKTIPQLCEEARAMISAPENMTLDYFEIVEPHSLQTPSSQEEVEELVAVAAAFVGEVRLIDNLYLKKRV